ncbi:PKD domain-containing protein [Flavobacterium chungangense]|uniref:PKD domain-containing protein n=1 Tax=Flavobacterium chungangense TaxID=554283 RepID=A0A6V6Z492_9FLAO|nr:PKD domain-containing protein [Flavobacterium chungangense]CAD0006409.1 hypothetical protein FLACHUCJ7_02807 [Flavobacterium chungangense]
MKKIYFIISFFVLTILMGCANDDSNIDLNGIAAPENISALTTVTQDNSGKVTFLPKGEGVTQYKIDFGDGSGQSDYFSSGANASHVYKEGVYTAKIIAMGLNGKTTEVAQQVIVSFKAPENLVVVVTNDLSVSKKVTVKASADYALFYDVYFGETGKPDPVSANNGESVSYTYKDAGVYTIRVVSKSAAIKTTEYSTQVTAKLVLNPTTAAPTPPNRQAGDVISIYGSKYTNVAGTNYFPDWGQAGQGSSWAEFDLNGDKMLNYIKLSYQGIALADGASIDVSGMEYLHMDVWTADLQKLETSLINVGPSEKPVTKDLTANQWTSIDIPISAFTNQGLSVDKIFQLKLVGTPWAGGTVFIDNIYFYKTAAQSVQLPLDFESAALTYAWGGFGDAGFGPIPVSVVTNPDKTGANISNKVVKIEKTSGAQVWAGASLNLENTIDFTKGTTVKVNAWSPKVGADILYKMEVSTSPKDGNGNPTVFFEAHATTTTANAWQVLTFDLTTAPNFSTANKYDRIILFPDFGQMGTGSVYYFDDIKQSN